MVWKKVAESKDLIILEKDAKDSKIKIEARKTAEFSWEVFKTKVNGDSSRLISEYVLDDKNEVKTLIEKLKTEDSPTAGRLFSKNIPISLKREYKEDYVEKWHFTVGKDKSKNMVFIKYEETITADLVMHEKYKPSEKQLISQIEEKLGLAEIGENINYSLYYFRKHTTSVKKNVPEYNLMDVEFGFFGEDEN